MQQGATPAGSNASRDREPIPLPRNAYARVPSYFETNMKYHCINVIETSQYVASLMMKSCIVEYSELSIHNRDGIPWMAILSMVTMKYNLRHDSDLLSK